MSYKDASHFYSQNKKYMRGAEIEPHMIDQQIRRCEKNLDRQVALDRSEERRVGKECLL